MEVNNDIDKVNIDDLIRDLKIYQVKALQKYLDDVWNV